jgi:hypothetical protein
MLISMSCEIYFLFASGLIKEIDSEIIPKNHNKSTIVVRVQFDQNAQQSMRNILKTGCQKMGDRFIFLTFSTRINHGQET